MPLCLNCAHCGILFDAVRKDAKYCSSSCRNKALRQRREDRHRAMADLLRQLAMVHPSGDPHLHAALAREARRIASEPY